MEKGKPSFATQVHFRDFNGFYIFLIYAFTNIYLYCHYIIICMHIYIYIHILETWGRYILHFHLPCHVSTIISISCMSNCTGIHWIHLIKFIHPISS